MLVPLNINVFDRGAGGIPTTTLLDDLGGRASSYTHTITASGGFESCQVVLAASLPEAMDWMSSRLGCSVIVAGPEATTVWEGRLVQIDATFGQEQRSVALDGMANRVRVKYTTVLGTPGTTASASDTASQALYGVKDVVLPVSDSDATEAGYYRDVELAARADPSMKPNTTVAAGDIGDVSLTLNFAGWYTAFGDLVTSNTSTTKTSTTTQIGTLTTAYNGVNAFFSTNYGEIVSSGITAVETIAPETTYRQKIESLTAKGTGAQRLAYGVLEGRKWKIATWAGATPTTITYQRSLTSGEVFDVYGSIVSPWLVRPNAMYQTIELLDPGPVSTAQDAAARFYAQRVTCTVSGDTIGVTLEPADPMDLSAIIIKKYG